MTDDGDAERARLEAIVYGRPGAANEAERAAAEVELARMAAAEAETASDKHRAAERAAISNEGDVEPSQPAQGGSAWMAPRPRIPRWTLALGGAVAAGLALAAALQLGRAVDSLEIFAREQVAADLSPPPQLNRDGYVLAGTMHRVASLDGLDVYVFQQAVDTFPEVACMAVAEQERVLGQRCVSLDEFSGGMTVRLNDETPASYRDVSWSLGDGATIVPGEYATAAAVLDRPQTDQDLAVVPRLGELAASSEPTVRWLGTSDGLGFAAYTLTGGICLGVFDEGPLEATGPPAKHCVAAGDFPSTGVTVEFPADDPQYAVTWGPSTTLTVRAAAGSEQE